jgi:hypothetical protein
MPTFTFDSSRFKTQGTANSQYRRQLERLAADGKQVDCIQRAVEGALAWISTGGNSPNRFPGALRAEAQ